MFILVYITKSALLIPIRLLLLKMFIYALPLPQNAPTFIRTSCKGWHTINAR